ncbi:MAG: carboxypeptidase regulatory-like domain-containing protein [Candidatus Omnitrophica bacterium]|nr:carboxypeptidase regulatory-like domain-containing protein [Candidatus Omnitrophota bacterium]
MRARLTPLLAAQAILAVVLQGCLNAPLPPQEATLTATFRLEGSENHEGVEVILPGTSYRGYSSQEGRVVFDHLPPRTYELLARKEGYAEYRERRVVLEGGDSIDLGEIVLAPLPKIGGVAGQVALEAVGGATVEVELVGADKIVTVNRDGQFEFKDVPPGRYDLRVDCPGFVADRTVTVTVEAGSKVTLAKLNLKALSPIQAEPEEPEPQGAGMVPSASPPLAPIQAPKREATLRVVKPRATIDPEAPGILRGSAFFPDRTDHSGIVVRIVDPPREVRTDSTGAYLISDVPPGARTLRAEAEGYLAEELVDLPVAPGELVTAPRMELALDPSALAPPAPVQVYGQVLLADKGPQPGILVALEGASLVVPTGRDGSFVFQQTPPGTYVLNVTRDGYEPFSTEVEVGAVGPIPIPVITLQPEGVYLEVVETTPRPGERKVEVSDRVRVEIRFSERLLPRTARPSVSVSPPVAMRVGTPEIDLISIELLRTESPKVEFETAYTITIGQGLESTEGHCLEEPFLLTFTTGGPRILGTIPPSGSRDVLMTADQPIVIDFNKSVDLEDLARKIRIYPDTGEVPNLRQQRRPYGQRVEVQIQLVENRRYRVSIPRSLKSEGDGARYENTPYKVEFRTGAYDALPDRNDEYLDEFDEFLDQ